MISKSIRFSLNSVCKAYRGASLLYALFNNVHNNIVLSTINPTILVGYQALKRSFNYRTIWNCDLREAITLVNKNFHIVRRVSSDLSSSSTKMLNYLPFFASGNIVSGFGRGSKELGIPTANYPLEVVKSLPDCFKPGVYFGWANINNGTVYKMVMSIGWNPFYDNKEKSIETHILHDFNRDLYGCLLKVCIVGYLRPEQNFNTLEDLVACIKDDIRQAEELLESNEIYKKSKNLKFFQVNSDSNSNSIKSK